MNRLCARFATLSMRRTQPVCSFRNSFSSLGMMNPTILNVIKPVQSPSSLIINSPSQQLSLILEAAPKKTVRPIIIDEFKMDSVKRKRHRKMKKHKYRKRLKKTRSLRKRLGKR